MSENSNPYDEVLYTGYPFPQTHPDRLATMARLFGMNPAPIEGCRVLELGCGDGGNLIPMAYTLPDSEFVGLDLGARGIANGQKTIEALGLANVQLRCLDILESGAELGRFDYVIAHGVYSWVPPTVQERILAICRESLNPQGVAFVSYSVYPGAHVRNMIAEMMSYCARRFSSPAEQIEQARAMLAFLSVGRTPEDTYSRLLDEEIATLHKRRPESLFHDELSEVHTAVYFHEFVERSGRHELQYLAEADFFEMLDSSEPPEVIAALRQLARNPIEKEQYLDFRKCRRFRQTLLCHAAALLNRHVESEQMRQFFVGSRKQRDRSPEKTPSQHPVARTAMAALIDAWPAVLSFDELRQRTGNIPGEDALLCDVVLGFFACGLFQLHTWKPPVQTTATEHPRASAVARWQASTEQYITHLRHGTVRLEDAVSRRLLCALDGTRDRAALLAAMRTAVSPAQAATLERDLEQALASFAKLGLLVTEPRTRVGG